MNYVIFRRVEGRDKSYHRGENRSPEACTGHLTPKLAISISHHDPWIRVRDEVFRSPSISTSFTQSQKAWTLTGFVERRR